MLATEQSSGSSSVSAACSWTVPCCSCHRYEETRKDVSKWQAIVKANREAPTLKFAAGNEDVPRTSTTAALTAKFAPTRRGVLFSKLQATTRLRQMALL